MTREDVKKFCKEHKKGIATTCGILVVSGVGLAIAIVTKKPKKAVEAITQAVQVSRDMAIPVLAIGKVTDYWLDGSFKDTPMAIINDVPLEKMGEFGEELLKLNNDQVHLTPESKIDIIGGFRGLGNRMDD